MTHNIEHFKKLLITEATILEKELETIGRRNPDNSADWEAVRKDTGVDTAEEGDLADAIETYENSTAIVSQLEVQLTDVKNALKKIEEGTYGTCEVCGTEIEEDRLEAIPSAKTCKAHMK